MASDVTVQATNWLADGHAARLMRRALTVLSSFKQAIARDAISCPSGQIVSGDLLAVTDRQA